MLTRDENISDEICRTAAAVADDDGHQWHVGDVFQHGAHVVGAPSIIQHLLVNKSDEICRSAAAVADDDGHRRRVGYVFQHGAHGVGAAFYHQAYHGCGGVCVCNNYTVFNMMS